MIERCPGQDSRNIQAEVLGCPRCGYKVEIFSDETKRNCPRCKKIIYREKLPSCLDWCSSARECIGEDRWRQLGLSTNQGDE